MAVRTAPASWTTVMQAEGTRDELLVLTGETDRVHLEGTGNLEAATTALRRLGAVKSVTGDRRNIDLTVEDAPGGARRYRRGGC